MKKMISKIHVLALATIFAAGASFGQQPATTPATLPAQSPAAPAAQSPQAQQPAQGGDQPDANSPTVKITADEVSLIFTVTDKHGKPGSEPEKG